MPTIRLTLLFWIFASILWMVPANANTTAQEVSPTSKAEQEYQAGLAWAKLLQKAFEGDPAAQALVGSQFAEGKVMRLDYTEAVKWFTKSAEQNYLNAQVALGNMYERGSDRKDIHGNKFDKNYDEALKWYRLAAEKGNDLAQSGLGRMYAQGKGVTQDFTQAYIWLSLAAAQGYEPAARKRDEISSKMPPEAILSAQKASREMQKKVK